MTVGEAFEMTTGGARLLMTAWLGELAEKRAAIDEEILAGGRVRVLVDAVEGGFIVTACLVDRDGNVFPLFELPPPAKSELN